MVTVVIALTRATLYLPQSRYIQTALEAALRCRKLSAEGAPVGRKSTPGGARARGRQCASRPAPATAVTLVCAPMRTADGSGRSLTLGDTPCIVHTDPGLATALDRAELQRARAEQRCMAAEDDRSALYLSLLLQRERAARWKATARRALARMAVSEQARGEAEQRHDLLLLQALGRQGKAGEVRALRRNADTATPNLLLDDPAELPGWGLPH